MAACETANLTTHSSRPNVVLIISDDQSWNDYGFMGHPTIKTPHIDRLAKEGLTFHRGYVPTSLCRPSLASMMTGLYPFQHRVTGNDPQSKKRADNQKLIDYYKSCKNLPTLFRNSGYRCFQSGKWWEGSWQEGGFTAGMTHGDPSRGGRHGDLGLKIGRSGMQQVFDFIDGSTGQPFFL